MKYLFTPALETRMRIAFALPRPALTKQLTRMVAETGIPRASIKARAIEMGIVCHTRSLWTAEDDRQLLLLLGSQSVRSIARQMRRSESSIKNRAARLDMSRRQSEGYSKSELRQILGAPVYRIAEWIERGWLGAPCDSEAANFRVTDEALTHFIFAHLDLIDFRLADQTFLKGVFRDGKRKSLPGQAVSCITRGSQKTRIRPRRTERTFQYPLVERGGYGSSAEDAPFVDWQDGPQVAAAS